MFFLTSSIYAFVKCKQYTADFVSVIAGVFLATYMMDSIPPEVIKHVVLNAQTPHLIKNVLLPWNCFKTNITEWCNTLFNASGKATDLEFQVGSTHNNEHPQWERNRQCVKLNQKEFFGKFVDNQAEHEQWATYSYKHLNELPLLCRDGVDFSSLGFAELQDISFWLGSPGAHTSCHFDTYGCNIVVQVYGRKSWLLFPPNAPLTPTRVPFEESSVYCEQNFFSPPNFDGFKGLEQFAHHVILVPGDILVVPPKWWHFVENLDVALSINTWIPLETDLPAQMDECIVKIQLCQLTQSLPDDLKKAVINPNEIATLHESSLLEQLTLLDNLAACIVSDDLRSGLFENTRAHKSNYLKSEELGKIIKENEKTISAVPNVPSEKFYKILEKNRKRFQASSSGTDQCAKIEDGNEYRLVSNYVNASCNPEMVKLWKRNLLKKYLENYL